jgi:cystathionine beta-lyase
MRPRLDLDAITIESLRAAGWIKWTRFEDDVIGAFVAEMDFGTAPEVTTALHRAVDAGSLGYLPTSLVEGLAVACADWQSSAYGWRIEPARIHPLADVIRGLEVAIEHFCAPDGAVVLPTPAYMPFFEVPPRLGREIIEVPCIRDVSGRYRMDLDGIGRALAGRGNLLVLCNPHNPIGRVYERDELLALADVVEANGGRVFSDEIHAPLVYAPAQHVPYASVSAAAAGHTVTATSASKAWNLAGLKCAQLIISNDRDAETWEPHAATASHGASSLGVVANTTAFTSGRSWLADVLAYLDGNRRALAELVAERMPQVGYVPPEGTYLAWLDCQRLELGPLPADVFHERARVALVDGSRCGAPGHVRLNFATPRPILDEIVARMAKVASR